MCMAAVAMSIAAQDLYIRFNVVPSGAMIEGEAMLTGTLDGTANNVGKPITFDAGNNPTDAYLMDVPITGDIYTKTFTLPAGNYEYQVVYADGTGTQGEFQAWTDGRPFAISEEKSVIFRAKIASDGYVRFLCDAQEIYHSNSTGYVDTDALPEPDAEGNVKFPVVYTEYKGNVQGTMYPKNTARTSRLVSDVLPSKGKYTFGGANGKTRWLFTYNRHTLTFVGLQKLVTLLNNDLIDTGNGLEDAATVAADLGEFSTTAPLLLVGGTTSVSAIIGVDGPAGGEKDNSLLKIAPKDIVAKMYYTATLSGESVPVLEGNQTLATTADAETATYQTDWTNSASSVNITTGLANGTYDLVIWYETVCHGDTIKSSEYATSFTVNNEPTSIENASINASISANNGIINATFEGTANVQLYTVSGQLINGTVATNNFSQAVQSGIYLLKMNEKVFKVIVK